MASGSLFIVLLAVAARTANSLYSKYALGRIDPVSFYLATNVVCAVAVVPFVYEELMTFFTLPALLVAAILGAGIFQAVTGILSNYALKNAPVSIYTVLSQLQLVWVITLAIAFLGEEVNLMAGIGIACILFASLLASGNLEVRREVGMKPILLIILSTFVAALAITIDSVLVDTVDTLLYFFLMLAIPTICFIPYMIRKRLFRFDDIRSHWIVYLVASLLFGATYLTLLLMYKLPDVPLSVSYSIRNTSGIFAVALAIWIFGERRNVWIKLLATAIAITGAMIVKLA